tara:strand:+ start:1183 stop:1734 length:552 start_codon:yes stop_codon:yes gene_type:complete
MSLIKYLRGRIDAGRIKLNETLIAPVLRENNSPQYTARSVAIGLFIAFTPTVGIQIPMVFATWATIRTLKKGWNFNPVIASAWTFLTNVFTVPPVYFVFLQTGRIMLGRWENIRSYEQYSVRFEKTAEGAIGWIDSLYAQLVNLMLEFGLPLFVGSLPWAVAISLGGYFWTLRFVIRYQRKLK